MNWKKNPGLILNTVTIFIYSFSMVDDHIDAWHNQVEKKSW